MFGKKKLNDPAWTKTGSFVNKPSRGWLHSDESLADSEGGVCYAVKYVGCIQVLKSMRTLQYDMRQQVTREAILRCCEAAGYMVGKRKKASKHVAKLLVEVPNMNHSGSNINLTVGASGIKMVTIDTGTVIGNHDMQGISFASGGEKEWIDMVGYVAKDSVNGRACHVFDCGGDLAYDVINTVGQAFEIRYKMFLQNPPQAMQVPERFSETIFGDESTYNEIDEGAASDVYAEPRSEAPKKKPEYQVPKPAHDAYAKLKMDPFGDLYDNPGMQVPPLLPTAAGYDVPKGALANATDTPGYESSQSNRNTVVSMTSLECAPGAMYDLPDPGTATYDNPLSSLGMPPDVPRRHDSLEDKPRVMAQYQTPSSLMAPQVQARQGWAVFDEGPQPFSAPPPPPMATHPEFNKRASEQPKKPPPIPKPYAKSKNKSKKPQGLRMGEVQSALPSPPPTSPGPDSLRDSEWFHGEISRAEAELLLEDEGDFLVRESKSQPGQFVLSGVQGGHPRHLLLVDPQGQVRTKDKVFENVEQLIAYHQENDLPIISSGSSVKIKHPVINVKHS